MDVDLLPLGRGSDEYRGTLTGYFRGDPMSAPRSGPFTLRRLSADRLQLDTEFIHWRMSVGTETGQWPQSVALVRR